MIRTELLLANACMGWSLLEARGSEEITHHSVHCWARRNVRAIQVLGTTVVAGPWRRERSGREAVTNILLSAIDERVCKLAGAGLKGVTKLGFTLEHGTDDVVDSLW